MKNTDKKILIISHNPLSRVNNNGKTLVSIFEGVPKDHIYQIYLNSDTPDYSEDCHYLQLNEKQILSSLFSRKNLCCQEIKPTSNRVSSATIQTNSFGIQTMRLLRECVWKIGVWQSALYEWLKDKQFDVVFFMAGDGLFAYDVYRFVLKHISSKGCLFFTDDYILGASSYSPVALLRRFLLKQKIKQGLQRTQELYVISDEMREAYYQLFHKDSYVIRNFSIEKKLADVEDKKTDTFERITIVYAGGLHYNRWKVLSQIANALKEINNSNQIKCKLKIYSSQTISNAIREEMTVEGVSEFCGRATASQIADIYANSDILLHVESFEKKAIASTKYSFSTKIPEYLSAGKCILAVGPSEVASIKYLENMACVICDHSELISALTKLINDDQYRQSIKFRCADSYNKDFGTKKQQECLSRILSAL